MYTHHSSYIYIYIYMLSIYLVVSLCIGGACKCDGDVRYGVAGTQVFIGWASNHFNNIHFRQSLEAKKNT